MKVKSSTITLTVTASIILAGAVLRLAAALHGWNADDFPAAFIRPDTPGYTAPALTLAFQGYYEGTGRAPGFPALLALCFRLCGGESYHLPVILLLLAGIATTFLIYLAVRLFTGRNASPLPAQLAAALYALNLTAVANAPMLLTDTLFGLLAAGQWCIFAAALQKKRCSLLIWAAGAAAAGALIRPINSVWIFPLAVLILLMPGTALRSRIMTAIAAILLFGAILLPWMLRNRAAGAGMVIDTNTGAMYHQNGAMLLAAVKKSDFETEKARLREEQQRLFADKVRFPDEASREKWRMDQLKKLILKHPFIWLRQHFNWHILLPDLPTFSEISGATSPGRGTMGVLAREGIFAAVDHYFAGKRYILWYALPLLMCTGVLYLAAFCRLAGDIIRRRWYLILVFLAFAEYYFFLPGAITAPRYQLPALPCLCTMAGLWLAALPAYLKEAAKWRRERSRTTPAEQKPQADKD